MDNEFLMFDTVSEVYDFICKKCNYGEDISALNSDERIIYIVQTLEQEVNGGGFDQYFYNSSGDLANETVAALITIGAKKTAKICQKALKVFGGSLPTDRAERQEYMDKKSNSRTEAKLEKCDNAFYEYQDSIERLCYEFIEENCDSFNYN